MTVAVIVIAALAALLVLFVVLAYNRLVRLRNETETGWSNIDVQLRRRFDLVPNLVETVEAYARHERETFENVTRARAAAAQAGTPVEAAAADTLLGGLLGHLVAIAEDYPELRASENFLKLQQELSDIEDKLAAARRYYNQTVYRFNTLTQTFPTLLVARPFGFREREFFETEGEARDVVQVDLAR